MKNETTGDSVLTLIPGFKEKIVGLVPNMITAILILLIGILLAFLLRIIVRRIITNAGRFFPNQRIRRYLDPSRLQDSAYLIGTILYWIVIIFFFTLATETAGFPVLSVWLGGIVNYLPKILVAAVIIIFGHISATIVQNLMQSAAQSAGIEQYIFIGRFGRYFVWLLTLLIGIDQLGLEISSLIQIILLILAAVLFGAALAFGLGAKSFVSDILASHYIRKNYGIGDQIRIGNFAGRIIELTPMAVLLDTTEGLVYIPSKNFYEQVSILTGKAG